MDINLLHGDCLELMKDIPDGSIDMILCDLPYGTTACKWDTIIPFEPLWEQYERIIKDNGAIVLTANQPFTTNLIQAGSQIFRYTMIWEKEQGTDFYMAKKKPLKNFEDICVFYKKQPTYNPQMVYTGKEWIKKNTGNTYNEIWGHQEKEYSKQSKGKYRYPTSVLRFDRPKRNRMHPTQKPVALFEYLIKTYTNEGDTVLDNVMGSGTTGVACKKLNRNFIGMELDDKYFDIAKRRISEA